MLFQHCRQIINRLQFPLTHNLPSTMPSASKAIEGGQAVEIVELDRSGVVQRKWIHNPDNTITQVRIFLVSRDLDANELTNLTH